MKTQDTNLLSVTFRASRELIEQIDRAAAEHSKQLDLPVDRSALIRRALAHEFQGKATSTTAKAGR